MDEVDKTAAVTEQASQWWVLLNSGPATAEEHRAFGEWVARSPERVEAFLQTARITKALKSPALRWPDTPVEELAREIRAAGDVLQLRGSASAVHSLESAAELNGESNSRGEKLAVSDRVRSWTWLPALAASVLGVIAVAGWLVNRAPHYATAIGEQRSVVLEDGSVVTLNTASRIDVDFEKDHRTIRLAAGEALFQVAHDPARPFDVIVGETRVRAVGTQFNVDRRAAGTTVTVVEGKVAVLSDASPRDARRVENSPAPLPLASSNAAGLALSTAEMSIATNITYLIAGQQLTVAHSPVLAPAPVDVTTATAWTQRRLVFEHRPLGEVADEFNRYNRRAIRIDSAQLRAQEVTGVFQANDPDSFLEFVSGIPGVRIERDADGSRVSAAP